MHTRRTSVSADARLLFQPAATYRELSQTRTRAAPLTRALFFLLVLGCALSFSASGRLSLRLILDGAVSFAFLPAFAVIGFAAVYFSRGDRPLPFPRALDLFLTGLSPWILWLVVFSTICAIVPPRRFGPWIWPLEISLLVPAVWSVVLDFHFFSEPLACSWRAATRDILLYRLIAWCGATAYFFGIAIWYEVVPLVIGWFTR